MPYADRKNTMSKEATRALSKWAAKPDRKEPTPGVSQQRKDLWTALNAFVSERGGAITTPMFISPVRIEVAPDSELPERLTAAGYDLTFCEQTTRIGPPVSEPGHWGRPRDLNRSYSFHAVNVYELRLPK